MHSLKGVKESEKMKSSEQWVGRGAGQWGVRRGRMLGVLAGFIAALVLGTPSVAGALPIAEAAVEPVANARTPDVTLAGAHPDLRVYFKLEQDPVTTGPVQDVDTVKIDLPPGVIANPQAAADCLPQHFANRTCSPAAQVGEGSVMFWGGMPGFTTVFPAEIYNLTTTPNTPSRMGVMVGPSPLGLITAEVTPEGDYAIKTTSPDIARFLPIISMDLKFWGIPGDRNGTGDSIPYVSNPTQCDTQPEAVVAAAGRVDQAFQPVRIAWPQMTGCQSLPFQPSLTVSPVVRSPGAASKVDVDVKLEQNADPNGRSAATLRRAVVNLPDGMSINPGMARDLSACSDQAFGLKLAKAPECASESRIGTVSLRTPLLAESLPGEIYTGQPLPGNAYRLFVHIHGKGTRIKLEGEIRPDPKTGRLLAIFDNNPQLPFSWMRLTFRGGSRSVLAMSESCGSNVTQSEFESWAGQEVQHSASFLVQGDDCASTFTPNFKAGTQSPVAGDSSQFSIVVASREGNHSLGTIRSLRLPEGLLGNVAAVPLCGDAPADAGECPETSRIGHVQAALGAKIGLLWVPQAGKDPTAVYLSGPYGDAPYSLSIVVPAQAGPFDLGRVVIRAGLHIDERTTAITTGIGETRVINTDGTVREVLPGALPTILDGIVLRQREVRVIVDRDDFMVNPTDCSQKRITAEIFSDKGDGVDVSDRFRAVDCALLGFKPRFGARILNKGRRSTLRSFHPRVRFTVVPRKADANISGATVVLPSSTMLDQANIGTTCTRAQMAERNCPEASIVGYAKAWSPLLKKAVAGPVYLAANGGVRPLPDLVAVLDGEIRVVLQGEIATRRGGGRARLQNTFRVVPDAPVSRFVLTMRGGAKRGLLVNSTDLCRSNERGAAVFHGQNGRTHRLRPRIATSFRGCGKVRRQVARRSAAREQAALASVGSGLR